MMKKLFAALCCATLLAVPAFSQSEMAPVTVAQAAKSCCAKEHAQAAPKATECSSKKMTCEKSAKASCDKTAKAAKSCCDSEPVAQAKAKDCSKCEDSAGWMMPAPNPNCKPCQTAKL